MSLLKSRPDIIIVDPSARAPRTSAAPLLPLQVMEVAEQQETSRSHNVETRERTNRLPENRRNTRRRLFGWLSGAL